MVAELVSIRNYVIFFARLVFTLIPSHAVSDCWYGGMLENEQQTNIDTIYSWHFCLPACHMPLPAVVRIEKLCEKNPSTGNEFCLICCFVMR